MMLLLKLRMETEKAILFATTATSKPQWIRKASLVSWERVANSQDDTCLVEFKEGAREWNLFG